MRREKKEKRVSFLKLSNAQREAVTRQFDKGMSLDDLHPLSAKGKLLWRRAKRGRPRVGEGSRKVLVTLEGGLLRQADRYAKERGLNRSQVMASGLRALLKAG